MFVCFIASQIYCIWMGQSFQIDFVTIVIFMGRGYKIAQSGEPNLFLKFIIIWRFLSSSYIFQACKNIYQQMNYFHFLFHILNICDNY